MYKKYFLFSNILRKDLIIGLKCFLDNVMIGLDLSNIKGDNDHDLVSGIMLF